MVFTRLAERFGILEKIAPRRPLRRERDEEKEEEKTEQKEAQKEQLLAGQHARESEAAASNRFVKNQRVKYHNRATDTYCDAVVIGVHLDDDPNHPYYTISFKKQVQQDKDDCEDGAVSKTDKDLERPPAKLVQVEKQTTSDRLVSLPWDKEATWRILEKKL